MILPLPAKVISSKIVIDFLELTLGSERVADLLCSKKTIPIVKWASSLLICILKLRIFPWNFRERLKTTKIESLVGAEIYQLKRRLLINKTWGIQPCPNDVSECGFLQRSLKDVGSQPQKRSLDQVQYTSFAPTSIHCFPRVYLASQEVGDLRFLFANSTCFFRDRLPCSLQKLNIKVVLICNDRLSYMLANNLSEYPEEYICLSLVFPNVNGWL